MLSRKYFYAISCACFLMACSPEGGQIGGGVSEETNTFAGVLVDVSGKPVSGATVLARHVSVDSIAFQDTTDGEGKFSFALKHRGNYALSSTLDSMAVYKTFAFDGSEIQMELPLSKALNYRGQVALSSDIKSKNVKVSLPGSHWSTTVDSLGYFQLEGVPVGTLALLVSSPDQYHANSTFALYLSEESETIVGPLPTSIMFNLDEVDLSVAEGPLQTTDKQVIQLPLAQDYGLVSWWTMDYYREVDETKATTLDSKNRTDAIVVYGPECFVPGISGKAIQLQSARQFGVIEDDKGILDSLTELTFEVMVKIDSLWEKVPYRKNMVGKLGFGSEGDNDVFSFAVIDGDCGVDKPTVGFFLADGSGDSLSCANAVIAADAVDFGSWENIVVTWNGDRLDLYKNGMLNASNQVSVKILNPSKEPIFFGKEDINFTLDDVRLGAKSINSTDVLYRYYLKGGSL
ncbi:MAG: hypothetical protein HUK19_00580 [Fibrobacter sp.]|nr:hypothetical protein [Fibrobacter sp.]